VQHTCGDEAVSEPLKSGTRLLRGWRVCSGRRRSADQSGRIGFSPLDSVAANHLVHFVATAYETPSLVVTSNWPFEQWTNFLPDATSATAILDRFLHHAEVVVLGGESYRLRETRAHPQRPDRPRPSDQPPRRVIPEA
jgi:hypothetical protein